MNGSRRKSTAMMMAKIELVSRRADAGATGACAHTHRISRYDTVEATAIGTAAGMGDDAAPAAGGEALEDEHRQRVGC